MFRLLFRMQEQGPGVERPTQEYALVIKSESRGKINASRRLPNYTSSKGGAKELHTVALGSIIDCRVQEADEGVLLDCAIESSAVASEQPAKHVPVGFLPVMNSRQVQTTAVVPLGPEVQIARLDDPTSGSRLEVFVTAERFLPMTTVANPSGRPAVRSSGRAATF